MRASTRLGDWMGLVAMNAMWAAQYPAYKTASAELPPFLLTTVIFALAAAVALPFALRDRRQRCRAVPQGALSVRRTAMAWVLVGGLGLVPASALLARGTELSTASNAALLSLSVPILTALLASVALGEHFSRLRVVSLVLCLTGVLVMSRADLTKADPLAGQHLLGNGLLLASCVCNVLYNVFSKDLLRRYTGFEVLAYGYVFATFLGVVLTVTLEPGWADAVAHASAKCWASTAVLSLVSWGLAMVIWMSMVARLDVSLVSLSIYLLPFLGLILSALLLGERLGLTDFIGGAITLTGTLLVTLRQDPSDATA